MIIAVRDDRIAEVAERLVREQRLRREQVLLHTSGAHASDEVLAAARPHVRGVGTWHPLVSFADPRAAGARRWTASRSASRATSRRARWPATWCARWAPGRSSWTARACRFTTRARSWPPTTWWRWPTLARALLVAAGVSPDQALPALIPLMSSVVQNLSQLGLPGALTGPVERGDVSSVEQHLRILDERAPEMLDLYRRLGRDVLRLAREKSPLRAGDRRAARGAVPGRAARAEVKDPPEAPMKNR